MVINQLFCHRYVLQPSIQLEGQFRKLLFQEVNTLVHQRRNAAILSGVETLQDSLPGMDDEVLDRSRPPSRDLLHKGHEELKSVELIYPQTTLDCAWDGDCFRHCLHALPNQHWLFHQASPKRTLLHSRAGAPDIQVDLIITILFAQFGSLGQLLRIASPQLKHNGMLLNIERKQMGMRVEHSIMMQHLRINHSPSSEKPHEVSKVGVGDVDHRRNRKGHPLVLLFHYISFISNPNAIRQVPIISEYISPLQLGCLLTDNNDDRVQTKYACHLWEIGQVALYAAVSGVLRAAEGEKEAQVACHASDEHPQVQRFSALGKLSRFGS